MTPPDWLLQLFGGAVVVTLFMLLYAMWPFGPVSRRGRLTREQKARLKQQQQRQAAHEREVMRPGLIHAAFNRDHVSRGDMETHGWCWRLMMFEHDLPISAVLNTYIHAELPTTESTRASWLIQLHEQLEEPTTQSGGSIDREGKQRVTDIAIMAPEWNAPRLLCPDFPISKVGNNLLYAHYHSQQDPETLYQTYQHRLNPRVETTRSSSTYDPSTVDPIRRTMVRRSPIGGRGTRPR